jgi:hypothetical protein
MYFKERPRRYRFKHREVRYLEAYYTPEFIYIYIYVPEIAHHSFSSEGYAKLAMRLKN